jgi:hypothetical protein
MVGAVVSVGDSVTVAVAGALPLQAALRMMQKLKRHAAQTALRLVILQP